MSTMEWMVVMGGVALVVWINWYFFMSSSGPVAATAGAHGTQDVTITVKGGYDPANVRVTRGQPVRLTFDRQETSSCSEEVVFPDFGVKRFLPAFEKTTIELEPKTSGTYEFTCGMGMLRGKLTVADA